MTNCCRGWQSAAALWERRWVTSGTVVLSCRLLLSRNTLKKGQYLIYFSVCGYIITFVLVLFRSEESFRPLRNRGFGCVKLCCTRLSESNCMRLRDGAEYLKDFHTTSLQITRWENFRLWWLKMIVWGIPPTLEQHRWKAWRHYCWVLVTPPCVRRKSWSRRHGVTPLFIIYCCWVYWSHNTF